MEDMTTCVRTELQHKKWLYKLIEESSSNSEDA